MWIYIGNKFAKFHGNILSLSENIAKSFRGATFLTHTVDHIGDGLYGSNDLTNSIKAMNEDR